MAHVFVVALGLLALFLPEERGERDEDDGRHDSRDDDGDDGGTWKGAAAGAAHAAAGRVDATCFDVQRQRSVTDLRLLGLHEPSELTLSLRCRSMTGLRMPGLCITGIQIYCWQAATAAGAGTEWPQVTIAACGRGHCACIASAINTPVARQRPTDLEVQPY